ncbi:uncharacterized protein [Pseudorasbora parva]|uniref:uncharacterized protein n=1 Tax=Pseudorasbora parva TaxID=51549 RepID=UPI00351F0AB6
MSSEERSTSFSHAETSERPSRPRRTPKHLEEYLLDYGHHRPALSSPPTAEVPAEQRGAAAAVGINSQSRSVSRQGEQPDTSSLDMLNMSSLRKILKSISEKERDEAADMTVLHSKLKQYENRQRRRKELMEHITSFLREEEDEDDQFGKPPTTPLRSHLVTSSHPPPASHSTLASQSPEVELLTQGQVSPTHINSSTPAAEADHSNPGFVPIQPVASLPLYSPLSSGTLPGAVAHATRAETVPIRLEKEFYRYGDAGNVFQPQVQPLLVAPTPTYQHPSVPYLYTTVAPPPRQPAISLPTSFSIPHYTSMPPVASVPHRPLHAAPQPKIPDFVNDNEREFANLKLALDNLLEPHAELDEKYKYHILLEHLKLPEAQMIGQSCRHHSYPYSAAMQALQLQYGQPHQLAQSEIAAILTAPEVKSNDANSFQSFALRVHLLVSMLLTLEGPRGMELNCCSHVDRLLSKLPKYLRDGFIEFLLLQGKLNSPNINPYNLQDFAGWLQVKAQQQRLSSRLVQRYQYEKSPSITKEKTMGKPRSQSTALYHGAAPTESKACLSPKVSQKRTPPKVNCLFCSSKDHYITRCSSIKEHSVDELCKWISEGKRCWKCARSHAPEVCTLKKPCSECGGIHLQVLHGVARRHATGTSSDTSESRIYLLPSIASGRVLLKVVPVLLHHKSKTLETYAILDDGAQRTMILPNAIQQLRLKGEPETLALRTVRPDTTHLSGSRVTFEISPRGNPEKRFQVFGAFTASGLDLVEQSYPVQTLQRRYAHLRGIPLQPFHKVRPLVLIGSDQVHLITPEEPIRQGNKGGELVEATQQNCLGASTSNSTNSEPGTSREAEAVLLRACQLQSFPEEVAALRANKPVPAHSRLVSLAPEWDPLTNMIRVGGRLRRSETLDTEQIHPIVLDPKHAVTKLLIKEFDERLLHPGAERVYAEIRRQYWILRGRQAIKHHQLLCLSCQRWRAQPKVPQMADLPPERLRLLCPPFYSTGVDCFGPYLVKIGRRNEKRWGLIFKCLTTRAVHTELLNSMDADAFLLALRRFIARRGKPHEIRSDCGTNFRGADRELREAFSVMEPELKTQLSKYQISFKFNPPSAPHFGGIWEREVRSIKNALQVAVGTQAVAEDVLSTVLVEVEGILNSKPLGYVSTDVADIDPITPNILLMGRRDASLPQVAYTQGDMGRRRWRHCQNMVDQFWIQFTRNYLPTLQIRQKWKKSSENLEADAVVLIVDPQLPRAQWPIGRVQKTLPGSDGCVRTAEVVIDGKTYLRPVARLIKLPTVEGITKDL